MRLGYLRSVVGRHGIWVLALAAFVVLVSCGPTKEGGGPVRIGTKNFTEQLIIGHMMVLLIEADTDLEVVRRFNLGGSMICHGALVAGEIDLYPEYTGTALTAILDRPVISDPDSAYRVVNRTYQERFGATWLPPMGFNNTYAITVRAADARRNGWTSISALEPHAAELRAGFTAEFMERADGYPGLKRAYGFEFGNVRDLDPGLMYRAIQQGDVDVICAFATDGRIPAYDLKLLRDDAGFFPPYYAAPVVRDAALEAHPEIEDALSPLFGSLSDSTMQRLNHEVDEQHREPVAVARDFLESRNYLRSERR